MRITMVAVAVSNMHIGQALAARGYDRRLDAVLCTILASDKN